MNPARVIVENPFSFCDGFQNLQCSTTCKLNVLRVTSTQTWKITSMWKFSFYEHLSSPHWLMSEQNFYPQVQILHICVIFSLWVEPTNNKKTTWQKTTQQTTCYHPH